MAEQEPIYGKVRTVKEVGQLARAHRKQRKLTQETIAGLSNVGTRFLSEFERGKATVEFGKALVILQTLGLEVIIQKRQGWGKSYPPTNSELLD